MLVKNWMSKDVVTVDADDSMQNAIYILTGTKYQNAAGHG